jgi:hypothetical protein
MCGSISTIAGVAYPNVADCIRSWCCVRSTPTSGYDINDDRLSLGAA